MDSITGYGGGGGARTRSRWRCLALLLWWLAGPLAAMVAPADPLISTRDDGCIVVAGVVVVDRVARSVTLPAMVNQHRGLVEYLLVHQTGKRHESLFTTTVRPQHLHLACLLVGAPETEAPSPPGLLVTVTVVWQGHGPTVRYAADQLLLPASHDGEPLAGMAMADPAWRYSSSQFNPDGFSAEVSGSCIALQADPAALMSAPGLYATEFVPAASRLPTLGSPVSLVLTFSDQRSVIAPTPAISTGKDHS
jgi:hypothetical protein